MSTRSTSAGVSARARPGRTGPGHKERSKNFTELEKRTVLELIAQHRDVLRQGRSNSATNKNKQLVWSTICSEVNKRCGGERPRTPAQVKMWYENYKKKCKMRATDSQDGTGLLDGMLWQTFPLGMKGEEDQDMTDNTACKEEVTDEDLPVNMSNGRLSIDEESLSNVLEPQVQIIPQSSPSPPQSPLRPLITSLAPLITPHGPLNSPQLPLTSPFQPDITPLQRNTIVTMNSAENSNSNMAPLNLSHLSHETRDVVTRDRDGDSSNVNSKNGVQNIRSQRFHSISADRDFNTNKRQSHCENGSVPFEPHCTFSHAPTDEEKLYFSAKRQHAIWEHETKMKILNMELRQKEEIFSLQKQLFIIELKLKMDFLEKTCNK